MNRPRHDGLMLEPCPRCGMKPNVSEVQGKGHMVECSLYRCGETTGWCATLAEAVDAWETMAREVLR